MSDWRSTARTAAAEYDRAEREADERAAQTTVDYLLRMAEQLGVRPTRGTARVGEQVRVEGALVAYRLSGGTPMCELRTQVDAASRPPVHLWLRHHDRMDWLDRGQVETLVDLGHALDPHWQPEADEPDDEPNVGDMLATVLEAIVREVVYDVVDGRLGDGPA